MANFDGTDAFFDSRDVIERIAELKELGDRYREQPEQDELEALITLQEEAEGYIADFQYGETFHTHDSLVEYAKELVMEMGYLPSETPSWITDNIDWEGVTEDIKDDYTEFEFRGTTYYAR